MGKSTENTETTAPVEPTPTPAPSLLSPAPAGPKPPWGSDDEFNPEKAWNLITNLRTELGDTKANLETSRKDAADLEKVRVEAQEASDARKEVEVALNREKAARVYGLNDQQFEFLAELTDAEAIETRAAKLAEMTTSTSRPVDPSQGHTPKDTGPSQLTKDDLRGMSPEAIDKATREGRFDDVLAGK